MRTACQGTVAISAVALGAAASLPACGAGGWKSPTRMQAPLGLAKSLARAIASALLLASLLIPSLLLAASDHCPVCGQPYGGTNYVFTDRVTHEKVEVCHDCAFLPQTCSLCGLPVKEGFVTLSDGRFLCARDARTAVVTADDAQAAFEDVHHSLAQLFSRFVSFPERNVEEALVDRVDLQALFKSAGDE